jgi:hypothetical protein
MCGKLQTWSQPPTVVLYLSYAFMQEALEADSTALGCAKSEYRHTGVVCALLGHHLK